MLLLAGRSQRAQASARSHTGALAGDYATTTALLRHAAVNVVETMEELVDVTELLARVKPPVKGPGIITNSGAVKGFALDFSDSIGFDVPRLAPATVDALKSILPGYASFENPVDITAHVLRDVSLWNKTAEALLNDPDVGSLCLPMVAGTLKYAMDKFNALAPTLAQHDKPAVIALLGDDFPVPARVSRGVSRGGRAGAALDRARAARARARDRLWAGSGGETRQDRSDRCAAPARPRHFAGIPGQDLSGGARHRDAAGRARARCRRSESNRAAHRLSGRAEGAGRGARAQERCGRCRAQHRGRRARSTPPGRRCTRVLAKAQPGLALDGILVEAMAAKGVEMIVGARRDPDWGPVVLVGLGGIWTEALGDVRLMPADLSREQIVAEINKLKGARLLHGLRGAPPVDVAAVADVVIKIGALMRARPEIREIDINPLIAYPQGVLALDALIVAD